MQTLETLLKGGAGQPASPVAFSQRDERWARQYLGTSSLTIGESGCLLTAVASLLADWGIDTDPGRLNAWLIRNGGYVATNLFAWRSIEPLGVVFEQLIDCKLTAAPVDRLRQALAAGRGVIVELDYAPGGYVDEHWVRLLTADDPDARIMDPACKPGFELRKLGEQYEAPGWDLARAVFAAGIYRQA